MPRHPRELSQSGFYHVFFRGVNHCYLFEELHDYTKMLNYLSDIQDELSIEFHAYCLMGNHAHLLLREKNQKDISKAMHKVLGAYAYWFNRKYARSGPLISSRYTSKPVDADGYLLSVMRYIHQNPVTAGMVDHISDYQWSSYRDYLQQHSTLTETSFILDMLAKNRQAAVERFQDFHNTFNPADFSEQERPRLTQDQFRQRIVSLLEGAEPHVLSSQPPHVRDSHIRHLRDQGFTIRQIERATGVSRGIIARVWQ